MRANKKTETKQKKDLEDKGVKMSEWTGVDPEWRKDEFEYQEAGDNEFLFGRGNYPYRHQKTAKPSPPEVPNTAETDPASISPYYPSYTPSN
jgi:hypothetical protein